MAKGTAALAGLPAIDIVLPAGNASLSLEGLKALAFHLGKMQKAGLPDKAYNGEIAIGSDPFFKSVWNITVDESESQYSCVLVSDSNAVSDGIGRAALSTRRLVDVTKLTSSNNATVKSFLAVINYIERLEDLVAKTGTSSSGDMTSETVVCRGNTPFESYEWVITKSGANYTLVTNANS